MDIDQMKQMQMANNMKRQEAFDKAIINLITENEQLKRQLNLMNINQQKETKKNEGRNVQPSNREKIKNKNTGRRRGGCLTMKKV
tara:strand:+ start:505 stop:759 length:255 start_codon:yes stop_codon:yes gene_type:complete